VFEIRAETYLCLHEKYWSCVSDFNQTRNKLASFNKLAKIKCRKSSFSGPRVVWFMLTEGKTDGAILISATQKGKRAWKGNKILYTNWRINCWTVNMVVRGKIKCYTSKTERQTKWIEGGTIIYFVWDKLCEQIKWVIDVYYLHVLGKKPKTTFLEIIRSKQWCRHAWGWIRTGVI
jgi:hypothetical protein